MALLRINAVGEEPILHGSPADINKVLDHAAQDCGPVVVMIHGYRYDPADPHHCPHRHIFSLDPDHLPWRSPSWPRQLGFGLGQEAEGLAIAFAWQARCTVGQAQTNAVAAGRALAKVISRIRQANPARPIHLIGHSLGTETAFEALHHLPANSINRIVALAGASYQSRVLAALATPAGQSVELFNITSRENDPVDFLFELLTRAPKRSDSAIGRGLFAHNVLTLQIDCLKTLKILATHGSTINRSHRRVCHWSTYTRPGTLRFYKKLLRDPSALPLAALRRELPERLDSRWSRLFSPIPRPAPVPVWQQL